MCYRVFNEETVKKVRGFETNANKVVNQRSGQVPMS